MWVWLHFNKFWVHDCYILSVVPDSKNYWLVSILENKANNHTIINNFIIHPRYSPFHQSNKSGALILQCNNKPRWLHRK